MDFKNPTLIKYGEEPLFIKDSVKLIKILRRNRIKDLTELMSISRKLAELNYYRFKEWTYPYNDIQVKPAFVAYTGDVYEGIKAWELDPEQIEFADKHVRIISGLYGILKPTNLIMPYRLEMGINVKGRTFNNLYEFWDNKLTKHIGKELQLLKKKIVINLASAEYAEAINFKVLKSKIITPFFLEHKNGIYKFVSFDGKKARGLMTRFIIDNKIEDVEQLKLFNYSGYSYSEQKSNEDRWVFVR